MTISFLFVFAGFLLIVAGVKNVSFLEALRGNFDIPKPAAGGGS